MTAENSAHAGLTRIHAGLQRLIAKGSALTATMLHSEAPEWTEAELAFWRSRDVAELQALADVAEIALDQPGEADHIRALRVINDQLEKLGATFDFREYEAGGGPVFPSRMDFFPPGRMR